MHKILILLKFPYITKFFEIITSLYNLFQINLVFYLNFVFKKNIYDKQQLQSIKYLYLHVPTATISITLYCFLTFLCLLYLINKNLYYNFLSFLFAKIGFIFITLNILTGLLWGKVIWGSYLVLDIRIYSTIFLFLFYFIYILFFYIFKTKRFHLFLIYFIIFGFINIPLLRFCVSYFKTIHQKSSYTLTFINIHQYFIYPIFLFFFFFFIFFLIILLFHYKRSLAKYYKKKINGKRI